MFIVTAKLKRRRVALSAVCLLALIALSAALLGRGEKAGTDTVKVDSNDARVDYLRSRGWQVESEPVETLTVPLPDELVEPYLSYNTLQLEQGFDLTALCGKTLERYTYTVTNYPDHAGFCQADLYVCEDAVVAGDIVCTGENGFMAGLEYPTRE